MVRFDWYQATVTAQVQDLRSSLGELAEDGWERLSRVPHGYGFGDVLNDADGALLRLWWGGTHDQPHVVASGESAQRVAEHLREYFPAHRVTRADVCQDYAEPGAYDRLQELALGVARERGIKVGTAGDHLLTLKGRTLYVGSPASHARLRVYDKAEELRAKFAGQYAKLEAIPDQLARFEVQVRPQTVEAKAAASKAEPVALIGSAAWLRELWRQVEGAELEPFQAGAAWRASDDARAYAAMLPQYGAMLRRLRADLGSWDCVGLQIGHDLAELEAAKRLRRQ